MMSAKHPMYNSFLDEVYMRRLLGRAVVVTALGVLVPLALVAQSSTNGIGGGYVGSSAWFASMQRSAENMAMLRALGGGVAGRVKDPVPPGYSEIAGQLVFPKGNPFPKGVVPELQISAEDQTVDGLRRSPVLRQNQSAYAFYGVLKRGLTYDFGWLYALGSKDVFGTLTLGEDAPGQVQLVISYDSFGSVRFETPGAPSQFAVRGGPRAVRTPSAPPPDADRYDMSGVPNPPTNFDEQKLAELRRADGKRWDLHLQLARYYEKKGDTKRAAAEYEKSKYWKGAP